MVRVMRVIELSSNESSDWTWQILNFSSTPRVQAVNWRFWGSRLWKRIQGYNLIDLDPRVQFRQLASICISDCAPTLTPVKYQLSLRAYQVTSTGPRQSSAPVSLKKATLAAQLHILALVAFTLCQRPRLRNRQKIGPSPKEWRKPKCR